MEDPSTKIKLVLNELLGDDTRAAAHAVDKFYVDDAQVVTPLLTTPKRAGKEAIKAVLRIRRTFAYKTILTFHCVAFGRVEIEKGIERVSGCVDLTQNFKFWPVPLPPAYNPTLHVRGIIRFELIKCPDDLYRIHFEEINLPTDWPSTGLHVFPFDAQLISGLKWMTGVAALAVGGTLTKVLG
ncbi:hypothetical protein JCM8202_000316 [Rhodotorula sphaerocarpa]